MIVEIPGKPQPKQRARKGAGGRWYTPLETRQYERLVKQCALVARPVGWRLDGRYHVTIHVFAPDKRNRDLDNIAKSILDGCNGILWADDAQVDSLTITRQSGPFQALMEATCMTEET
jgi:crossover junction endodeoxyribonuclease RusA